MAATNVQPVAASTFKHAEREVGILIEETTSESCEKWWEEENMWALMGSQSILWPRMILFLEFGYLKHTLMINVFIDFQMKVNLNITESSLSPNSCARSCQWNNSETAVRPLDLESISGLLWSPILHQHSKQNIPTALWSCDTRRVDPLPRNSGK